MSRSKTHYQGMNLQRAHRSEFDDSKIRDLARHDARLGENLKTVERARQVMMKSMDADKQLFIKAGAQANTKITRSTQGGAPRPANASPSLSTRLISDTKVKRSSVTDQPDSNGLSDKDNNKGVARSGKQRSTPDPDQNSTDTTTPSISDTGSIYDKFLENNAGASMRSLNDNRSPKLSTSGGRYRSSDRGMSMTSNSSNKTTKPPTWDVDETVNGRSVSKTDAEKGSDSTRRQKKSSTGIPVDETDSRLSLDNGKSRISHNKETDRSSTVNGTLKDQDMNGRKISIWDSLSTPKHTSTAKSKRNQIENEFSASKLKSSSSNPELLASTKPGGANRGRSTGTGHGRSSSQTGSGRSKGRQMPRNVSGGRSRNDT